MMAKMENLSDLMLMELQDTYDAEHQVVDALPTMAEAATARELKTAFQEHLAESKQHLSRLEQVFGLLGETPKRKTCKGMKGIIKEGQEMMEEPMSETVMNAALIAAAQRVEHYEMAAYGTLRTYATLVGNHEASQLFQTTLEEEELTDKKLSMLASTINAKAVGAPSTSENGKREKAR